TSKTPSYTKSVSWQHHRNYLTSYRQKNHPNLDGFS
ncbi:transposase, partial [Shigella sonnei]